MFFAHMPISQFNYCLNIANFFILSALSLRTTQGGKPYLSGVLSDASGRIPFVMWDGLPDFTADDVGKVVYVDGIVQEYRDAPQVKVDMLCLATDADMENIRLSDLVPCAPIDVEKAVTKMEEMLTSLSDSIYSSIAFYAYMEFSEKLEVCPAAKSIHHAFVGGLTMHTYHMMCLAELVYLQYKDLIPIDHDLLIAGTFLHDIGKIREFELTDQHLVKDYSKDGQLFGHPTLGVKMVDEIIDKYCPDADPDKVKLLKHIIVSHHGAPEYGAAVYPQSVEAEIVHQLDSLDSRLEIYRSEFSKTPIGKFSEYNRALDHCVFNHKTA